MEVLIPGNSALSKFSDVISAFVRSDSNFDGLMPWCAMMTFLREGLYPTYPTSVH